MGSTPIVGSVVSWRVMWFIQVTLELATAKSMGGYPSGQRDLTVNQLAQCLRRFESFTAHWLKSRKPGFRELRASKPS